MLQDMESMKKRIDVLQAKQNKSETEVAVLGGKLDTLMEMLRDEFKVSSVEEAQQLLVNITSQITEKETELQAFLLRIEAQVKEMEANG